jgi:hypothetical protein
VVPTKTWLAIPVLAIACAGLAIAARQPVLVAIAAAALGAALASAVRAFAGPSIAVAVAGIAVCALRGMLAAAAVLGVLAGGMGIDLVAGSTGAATVVCAALGAGTGIARFAALVRWPVGQAFVGAAVGAMLVVAPVWTLAMR